MSHGRHEVGSAEASLWPAVQPAGWAWAFGSYPAALALERGPRLLLAASILGTGFFMVQPPWRQVGVLALGYVAAWLVVAVGHQRRFSRCRRRSRSAGLQVVVLVPESPALMAWLYRRRGIAAAVRPLAYSIHVDPAWRAPGGLGPLAAAREFGRRYRQDYDRILAGLQGLPVLVGSSTFNRHDSAWALRAAEGGWCQAMQGPLFPGAPARNGPRARARQQGRMFGGVASRRRVDRPQAWRTRMFDCFSARAVS